ncbi:MAG: hypothetical protein IPM83_03360 [Ignavibacteria bacterium]|nr:hypothetical protein [Ignavibacteria bacterium]
MLTAKRQVLLGLVIATVSTACSTSTYFPFLKEHEIVSQTQTQGVEDLELNIVTERITPTTPLTLVVKSVSSKAIEIVRGRFSLALGDTLVDVDPLVGGSRSDYVVLQTSTRASGYTQSEYGSRVSRNMYGQYQPGMTGGESSTVMSTGELSGYITRSSEIVTLQPKIAARFQLVDGFPFLATETVIVVPEESGAAGTVNLAANRRYRLSNQDAVRRGTQVLTSKVKELAAKQQWTLNVAYRRANEEEVRYAAITYTLGNPKYGQRRVEEE